MSTCNSYPLCIGLLLYLPFNCLYTPSVYKIYYLGFLPYTCLYIRVVDVYGINGITCTWVCVWDYVGCVILCHGMTFLHLSLYAICVWDYLEYLPYIYLYIPDVFGITWDISLHLSIIVQICILYYMIITLNLFLYLCCSLCMGFLGSLCGVHT